MRDTTDGWVCSSLYKSLAWYLQPVNFCMAQNSSLVAGPTYVQHNQRSPLLNYRMDLDFRHYLIRSHQHVTVHGWSHKECCLNVCVCVVRIPGIYTLIRAKTEHEPTKTMYLKDHLASKVHASTHSCHPHPLHLAPQLERPCRKMQPPPAVAQTITTMASSLIKYLHMVHNV